MISVVLLAYREEESLKLLFPRLIKELDSLNEEYEIIVVDTAKPLDNTKGVCDQYGAVYVNREEPGFGGAYRKGISVMKGDKMLVLDSDGSGYMEDVFIGIRYAEEQGADVINLSLGGELSDDDLMEAELYDQELAGIDALVVCASGNGDRRGKALNMDKDGLARLR